MLKMAEELKIVTLALLIAFAHLIDGVSVPDPRDRDHHKCLTEIPTALIRESHNEVLHGNGSSMYWTQIEVCCEGYKRYEYDWNICVPDCGRKCENGICIAPNTCKCFQGHVKNDDGECVTTCPLGCLNGYCHYDGTCTCNPGFVLDRITRKFCRPSCGYSGCRESTENCTAPGKCECLPGYILINDKCEISCNVNCFHGKCVGPDKCECDYGYNLRDGVCQARCVQRCDNGICHRENECICNSGYSFDGNTGSCLPICQNECRNGVCIAVNDCKCFKGFVKGFDGNCTPHCSKGCIHGECISPEVCKCRHGKVDELGYCRGRHEQRCLNANGDHCSIWSKAHHY